MKKGGKQNRRAAPAAQAAAVGAAHAVLSHEAHVLRILQSPELEVDDLGRAACVCRAWRAAVASDDALFEAALRHESPALAAARSERVSCRALAASTRAALKVPRSRAPPWARHAAASPEEWTLVADVFCESIAFGDRRNVFSVSFPLSALDCLERPDDRDAMIDPDFRAEWILAVAREVEATERDVPSLDALRDMLGDAEMFFDGEREHFLRLLALHVGGGAAVVCSRKPSAGVTNYEPVGGAWGSDEEPFRGSKTMVFEPSFGTGPRLTAHLTLCPAPDQVTSPDVCVLGFSRASLEKGPRYDGPDTDTERSDSAIEDEDEEIEQQVILSTLALGPLRWSP